jgi:hypothetical protein
MEETQVLGVMDHKVMAAEHIVEFVLQEKLEDLR